MIEGLLFLFLLIVCVPLVAQCGTFRALAEFSERPSHHPIIYCGVRRDLDDMDTRDGLLPGCFRSVPATIDLPFSFVMDTVLLPLTIPVALIQRARVASGAYQACRCFCSIPSSPETMALLQGKGPGVEREYDSTSSSIRIPYPVDGQQFRRDVSACEKENHQPCEITIGKRTISGKILCRNETRDFGYSQAQSYILSYSIEVSGNESRMKRNVLEADERIPGESVELNYRRFVTPSGKSTYSLVLSYHGNEPLNDLSNSLIILLADGERIDLIDSAPDRIFVQIKALSQKSVSEERTFRITPDLIEKLAYSRIVRVTLPDEKRSRSYPFRKTNLEAFRRFYESFVAEEDKLGPTTR